MRLDLLSTTLLALSPAPESSVDLRWDAPEGCPSEAALREGIEVHTVRLEDAPRRIRARARVRESAAGYTLALVINAEDGDSEHELESADCELLANAAAFMIAVAMDPVAKADEELQEARDTAAETTTATEPPSTPPPNESKPASSRRPRGYARVGFGGHFAQLPSAAPNASLEGGLSMPWFRIGLAANYSQGLRATIAGQADPGEYRLTQWSAGPRVCARPRAANFEFPLCGAGHFGLVHGRSFSISETASDQQFVSAVSLGTGVDWLLTSDWSVGVQAQTWANLSRPEFVIDGLGRVFRAPLFSGAVQLTAEFRFPSPTGR